MPKLHMAVLLRVGRDEEELLHTWGSRVSGLGFRVWGLEFRLRFFKGSEGLSPRVLGEPHTLSGTLALLEWLLAQGSALWVLHPKP